MAQTAQGYSPQQFAAKWGRSELKERASAQEHFIDLCRMLGQPTPAEADAQGAWYTFEKGIKTVRGETGFADVWMRGHFAWEYKGKNKHPTLEKAYEQLLRYAEYLDNPPLLVVCDIERFEIHTRFTGTAKQVYAFSNDEIVEPENLRLLRALFTAPETLRPKVRTREVTEEAARTFASLADGLRARGVEPGRAAHFLTRLLFCLFAEDIGLLPKAVFGRTIEFTRQRPDMFTTQVQMLFEAMQHGGFFALEEIARFNGNLFADADVVELTAEEIGLLAEASKLDWSSIEPAIFGTLFERGLDPQKRSQLGAHYTSREDILLIVEPVLMEPLRREWDQTRAEAQKLVDAWWDQTATRRVRDNRRRDLERLLLGFQERLASITVLDPACGSGNFLYVALEQLKNLEKEVVTYAANAGLTMMLPRVHPRQLKGIEINAYAHELAQIVVWIGYIQWMNDHGFQFNHDPILERIDNILLMDALIDRSDPDHPREAEWPEADVIIGNPPFLGSYKLRQELGIAYVSDVFSIFGKRVPGSADLCCYWFEKARAMIESGKANRVGLLATNSIRHGANRRVLDRIKQSGDIFMAWGDRPWILNGAAVRVSMVGFDNGTDGNRTLDGLSVVTINTDLTSALDVTIAQPLRENIGIAYKGDEKGGPFEIGGTVARQMMAVPYNPNGRPNSDVVRPWMNALDITRRPRDMWIVDFGVDMPEAEASLYELPFEHVKEYVKAVRATNKDSLRAQKWWIHRRTSPPMRQATSKLRRYLVTPLVSKHRLFVWVDTNVLTANKCLVIARDDDYFFGVLHSKIHEVWSLHQCSWHGAGNDPAYNVTTCFETFPMPWPPGQEPEGDPRVEAIAEAARELNELRERWLNPEGASEAELKKRTLTNLYNARPTWLAMAHQRLDRAVFNAYGWDDDPSDDDILSRLLALNLERAAGPATKPARESPMPE